LLSIEGKKEKAAGGKKGKKGRKKRVKCVLELEMRSEKAVVYREKWSFQRVTFWEWGGTGRFA